MSTSSVFRLCGVCLLLMGLDPTPGVSGEYPAASIPESLKVDAHAVIRSWTQSFEVKSRKRALHRVSRVITILDEAGREFGELFVTYDKFLKIEDLGGRLYDAAGKRIRSLEKSDQQDFAAISEGTLFDDNRVRVAKLYHDTYPYTVEFEYEIGYDGYIGWPSWWLQREDASVEHTRFMVTIPAAESLRYVNGTSIMPVRLVKEEKATYVWEARGLKPFFPEPYGPAEWDQNPSVHIAPVSFEMEDHPGDLSSWNSFGRWYGGLQEGKRTLDTTARKEVLTMTQGITDKREIVKTLYEFLQRKTRYISIQLGIGGWQPFDAGYVWRLGYGDCKALTNFMISLLEVVEIPAFPALIYSDLLPRKALSQFPSNQFNHVVVAVPLEKDTVWLESTSQNMPFNRIGRTNENRHALLIRPEGGTIVRTPVSSASDNEQSRRAIVELVASGAATVEVTTKYSGSQGERVRSALEDLSQRDREIWLKENVEIGSFNLKESEFQGMESKSSELGIRLSLGISRFASVAGSRLMLQPNLMERQTYLPREVKERKHPVLQAYPYLDVDSIEYRLPAGYALEAAGKPVVIEAPFASFQSSVVMTDSGTIMYTRRLEMREAELPAGSYAEFRNFLQQVIQADRSLMVLAKR